MNLENTNIKDIKIVDAIHVMPDPTEESEDLTVDPDKEEKPDERG